MKYECIKQNNVYSFSLGKLSCVLFKSASFKMAVRVSSDKITLVILFFRVPLQFSDRTKNMNIH